MQSRITLLLVVSVFLAPGLRARAQGRAADTEEFFESKVRPVLAGHCVECHGPTKASGGLRLDSREALFKGGDSGSPNILPSPDNKLIMFSGRGVPGFSSQVQADVDTLSMYSGLNTNNYRLRWYDLSPWAP